MVGREGALGTVALLGRHDDRHQILDLVLRRLNVVDATEVRSLNGTSVKMRESLHGNDRGAGRHLVRGRQHRTAEVALGRVCKKTMLFGEELCLVEVDLGRHFIEIKSHLG